MKISNIKFVTKPKLCFRNSFIHLDATVHEEIEYEIYSPGISTTYFVERFIGTSGNI